MSMTAATGTLLDYKPLMLERRTFLKGVGVSLIAAPAIVRFDSIMPVRALPPELLQPPPKSWVDVWWCEPPCLSAPMQKWEDYSSREDAPRQYAGEGVRGRACGARD
jgi:hypothetical protein